MNRAIAAVVFDLDGTLLDSTAQLLKCLRTMLARWGLSNTPDEVLRGSLSSGSRELCACATRFELLEPELARFMAEYHEVCLEEAVRETRFIPAARELLDELSGWSLAICSNKPRRAVDAVLSHLQIAHRFRSIVAAGDVAELKPSPLALGAVAAQLGTHPEQLVMVGDSPDDIRAGQSTGARTIAFTGGGIWSRAALEVLGPTAIVDSMGEVRAALGGLLG